MKLNLLLDNPAGILNGYVNVDPFAKGQDERVCAEVTNLDSVVSDGEAEEILAYDILHYFPMIMVDGMIANWLKKLSIKGGKLAISATDLYEVSRQFWIGDINADKANCLLYGMQNKVLDSGGVWDCKKCCINIFQLEQTILSYQNFKILKKTVDPKTFEGLIVCQRKQ